MDGGDAPTTDGGGGRGMRLRRGLAWVAGGGLVALLAGYFLVLPQLGRAAPPPVDLAALTGDPARGEMVFRAGSCAVCHTDVANEGSFLAGGAGLKTVFGTFYGPNITPDPEHGMGAMSLEAFYRALTEGVSPEGEHYFPSFPYTSYVRMTAQDIVDLKAYLDTVDPVAQPSRPHDLSWPFSDRAFVGLWKELAYTPEPFQEDPAQDAVWNRGAYLATGPGHCGECHTARNSVGALSGPPLQGAKKSGFGEGAPALAGPQATIRDWEEADISFYLQIGLRPDGDSAGGKMADVIEHGSGYLPAEDLDAMAAYLAERARGGADR